ncbi:MAG: DUF1566 domain-containing protein [Paludibacter sp.]|jgi:hypothetical protein|nr:DUF1566 domain-containing protein [Paludibacter sp.]
MKYISFVFMLFIANIWLVAQTSEGGGVYAKGTTITSTVVSENFASGEGTGVYVTENSSLYLSTVADNRQVKTFIPKTGDFIDGGLVFFVDNKTRTALIVSPTEMPSSVKYTYKTYGEAGQNIANASNMNDGKQNHNAIIAAQVVIPDVDADRDNLLAVSAGHSSHFKLPADTVKRAAHWCAELNAGGVSDWYLPSREELKKLYVAKDSVNQMLTTVNMPATPLSNGYYWSSTQANAFEAWYVYFDNGETNVGLKSNVANVRAIRKIVF